jgi:hypothetical protein
VSDVPTREFLRKRRDRAMASILGNAERNLYPEADEGARAAFRQCVVDALNGYHDSVLDLLGSESGTVRNEQVLELLTRLDAWLRVNQR